ncbi:MAG: protein phosphatase 2C domain-containing protein [Lachnospiraceae bacterium]|nr:protein phosphatase 2C domain-containing protein [Lachnospiraceae bacterium]
MRKFGQNMMIDTFCYTNKGGRGHNEDYAAYSSEGEHGLFVVADGLGGHQLGEVASSAAVDVLMTAWEKEDSSQSSPDRTLWLPEKLKEANERLLILQKERDAKLKSTAVALTIDGDRAVWAHVGDSRLYYIHKGDIRFITADHSVAYKKFRVGEISRAEINTDEDQSALLRSLGGVDRWEAEVKECPEPLEPGDGFFLCTDGAWEYLYDEEILLDFLKAGNAMAWTELLLLRIISRVDGKSNDNLTLLNLMVR